MLNMVRKDKKLTANEKFKKRKKMSKKEKLVREEYLLNGFNMTRAYLKIFRPVKVTTAAVEGSKLLQLPRMINSIDRRIMKAFGKLKVDNNMLIAGYINEVFNDQRPFFDENEVFIGMKNLNIAQQACIESVETSDIYEINEDGKKMKVGKKTKVKFYSKKLARDMLMKYTGLIKDGNTIVINKVDAKIVIAKQLKEEIGVSRVTEINRVLQEA